MITILNGLEVEVERIEYGSEPEDTYIISAYYLETGQALEDAELDELNDELGSELYDAWLEHQIGRAEYLND
jgi:hypothetical protein